MSRRLLVALVVACACGGPQRVRLPGVDYLDAIRVEGNHTIETGALEPALALHETLRDGAAVDPYLLAADTERIRIAYWKRGFFDAKVGARIERAGQAQVIVFTVLEGRRAVTRVEITGLPPELSPARARALVGLRDGQPFDYEAYDAAKRALKAAVENAGYARAEVPATVLADPAAATATVRYDVAPGAPARFGAIHIAGTVRPQLAEAVRGRLAFATGDRFSLAALEQSQLAITELGRFSTVQLVPDRGPGRGRADAVDVAIELAEASRHELHVGGGFGYEPATVEVRARGGFSFVPASQPLLTVATDMRAALTMPHSFDTGAIEPKVRLIATLQRLDLFRPHVRGEIEAGVDYQTIEAYTWTGEHARVGLGAPLGRRWLQLHLGWLLQRLEFTHPDPVLIAPPDRTMDTSGTTIGQRLGLTGPDGENRRQILGAYQASLVADLRDNPIDPHRGAYLDLRVAAGTRYAGSDLAYLQLTPELRGYVSLGDVVIAGRARVGAILGDVPVTERFYSGGSSGHRGFSDRRLSPLATAKDQDGMPHSVVIGGAALIETGVELRRHLGTVATLPVGANVFLDGGDVTESAQELDPSNLYWAVGAGLWSKLVGDLKIRVDVGYRLNRLEWPDPVLTGVSYDRLQWHLGVGESF